MKRDTIDMLLLVENQTLGSTTIEQVNNYQNSHNKINFDSHSR